MTTAPADAPIADRIVADTLGNATFDAYATTPPRTLAQAYALQDAVAVGLSASPRHGAIAGWKIAANSQALMDRFGLTEPASGRMFAQQCHTAPAQLALGDYAQFAFEAEIAAVMKTTLAPGDGPFDADTVTAAIDRFVPAFELLDMRGIDMPNAQIADVIAQNISNVGCVIGGPGCAPADLDTLSMRTTIDIDGTRKHDVTGAAPQPPIETVTWLANHLAARGLTLEAGQIVLCGTHCPIWHCDAPGTITVEMTQLGQVAITLA